MVANGLLLLISFFDIFMTKISDFPYPIYDLTKIWYPIYGLNGWKTILLGAAQTYIAHIREYPPPPRGKIW